MVVGASTVLTAERPGPGRVAALVGVVVLIAVWSAVAREIPDIGLWGDVALTVCVLFPLTHAVIWLGLPLARRRGLLLVAVAFGALAWVLEVAGADSLFNVAKLCAFMFVGFWFMELFEELWWIALVAAIIPWVDALSVWRGPTRTVVEEQPGLFEAVSVAFRLPGEGGSANVGPPDILFFALFMAAAARFRLRVAATFAGMTGLLGLTVVLAAWFDFDGLPALPAVAFGFLLPNADLIWRQVPKARRPRPTNSDV